MRLMGNISGVRVRRGAVLSVAGLVAAPALVLSTGTAAQAASCTAAKGPYQKQAEKWLKRTADGKQSVADCKAIRSFQADKGITPAAGYAGPVTWRTMKTITAQKAAGRIPTPRRSAPRTRGASRVWT